MWEQLTISGFSLKYASCFHGSEVQQRHSKQQGFIATVDCKDSELKKKTPLAIKKYLFTEMRCYTWIAF